MVSGAQQGRRDRRSAARAARRAPGWLEKRLARQKQSASREVLEYLADRVEGNLLAAHQELQKLALLAPEGELSLDTVRGAVADVARYDTYVAAEALVAGDTARYLRVLEGLRGEGEAPTYLLFTLSSALFALATGERVNKAMQARARQARGATRPPRSSGRSAARPQSTAIKGIDAGEPWEESPSRARLAATLDRREPGWDNGRFACTRARRRGAEHHPSAIARWQCDHEGAPTRAGCSTRADECQARALADDRMLNHYNWRGCSSSATNMPMASLHAMMQEMGRARARRARARARRHRGEERRPGRHGRRHPLRVGQDPASQCGRREKRRRRPDATRRSSTG